MREGGPFEKVEDMGEYLFRVVDDGGTTGTRYGVYFADRSCMVLSADPADPETVLDGRFDPHELQDFMEAGGAKDISFHELPPHMQAFVVDTVNEALAPSYDPEEPDKLLAFLPGWVDLCDADCHTTVDLYARPAPRLVM